MSPEVIGENEKIFTVFIQKDSECAASCGEPIEAGTEALRLLSTSQLFHPDCLVQKAQQEGKELQNIPMIPINDW